MELMDFLGLVESLAPACNEACLSWSIFFKQCLINIFLDIVCPYHSPNACAFKMFLI